MTNRIRTLVSDLAAIPGSDTLVNLFTFENPELDRKGAAVSRRANCEAYLRYFIDHPPRLIIVGEAGGYQGMRFSGIAFTSEYTLLRHPFFQGGNFERSAVRERPFREPSGSIVWETIGQLEHTPLLWNTVPLHPHRPDEPLSNRAPTREERELGARFLIRLLQLFNAPKVVAAGRLAAAALEQLNIPHTPVRHPSHGGKAEFQRGVLKLADVK
jgi:uracil-DNA glycosylase